ncbi:unnamed protein product [marine sediment metagenome]|uniref:Uncharacterized protein n=1 Tax=marine sediment metagenome TaxID=412755 RepID=X0X7H3_9ZZZZ
MTTTAYYGICIEPLTGVYITLLTVILFTYLLFLKSADNIIGYHKCHNYSNQIDDIYDFYGSEKCAVYPICFYKGPV